MHLGLGQTSRPTTRLRALLRQQRPLVVPGCYNALSARVLEHAGFPAIYMTGYGTSLSLLGLPDAGLATLTEMTLNARLICGAVRVPLIADADTGFGNAINVVRTVEEYLRAGVAGIHLEDQVSPKRCGHVAGREVIPMAEAVRKIRAASDTRAALDPDFVVIARTDARGAHGGTLEAAIDRANAFLEAGADMAFVEGPASVAEVERICREVRGPIFYNMTGISPRFTEAELADLGVAAVILPGVTLRATVTTLYDVARLLKDQGLTAQTALDARFKAHPAGDLHDFAGFDRIRALEEVYLPPEAMEKYADTLGHQPRGAAT